ncbi:CDP-alcohol phosphatidyltransferase family protein [Reyranella sp.]|jgi:phosphatidylglycerophosphate synthase|uniref:CDP-alcohol phosphatidyltransferase family protein n=1 Tax=Reyranella sp. TaxID=1929291 RepID=UPI002725E0E3|nr:CDP-alcohol phosphatidyltransferase family protein [Reyranella sp.]MDO8973632.1 CDP-alcohol phosphatidyltransferase family protein [Reyranella sp.]
MLDPLLRRWIGPPLDRAGAWLAGRGITANAVSVTGLAVGLGAVPLLAFGHYGVALLMILLNRLLDGLDGAVARHGRPTALGGYLDIVCDMTFYAAVPLGFALAQPDNAVWAALLLASFVCTCASFLGRAVLAAGRGERDPGTRGRKSFFHSAGLMEGTETILAFVLFCLLPGMFPWLAGAVAALCFWTAAARVFETFLADSIS